MCNPLQQLRRQLRLEGRLAGDYLTDRRDDLLPARSLEHVAGRSGLQRLEHVVRVLVHRHDHDSHAHALASESPRGGDSVRVWQADIHQHHIGSQPLAERQRLAYARRLADDLEIGLAPEQASQSGPG